MYYSVCYISFLVFPRKRETEKSRKCNSYIQGRQEIILLIVNMLLFKMLKLLKSSSGKNHLTSEICHFQDA